MYTGVVQLFRGDRIIDLYLSDKYINATWDQYHSFITFDLGRQCFGFYGPRFRWNNQ